jgi:hypothetical protein
MASAQEALAARSHDLAHRAKTSGIELDAPQEPAFLKLIDTPAAGDFWASHLSADLET